MSDFLNRINTEKKQKRESSINLSKKGSSHTINLKKNDNELSFNLNWNSKKQQDDSLFGTIKNKLLSNDGNLDLDLGCMYKLKDGTKGVVQALGNLFGSLKNPPYIMLDGDDRTGKNNDGETLKFSKIEELELAVIFAFIYKGAPNWKEARGIATIKQANHPDILISLNDDSRKKMVGIAILLNEDNNLKVEKVEKYYSGHKDLDDDFGFGFRWVGGSK
jgi:tellurite resistance protein TerA